MKCLEAEFASRFAKAYTITDVGSGLNARRKGLRKLLDLARFGYEYLEAFFAGHAVEVWVLHPDDDQTPEEELVSDMIALVTSFARRLYGRRSHKTKEIVACVSEKASAGL